MNKEKDPESRVISNQNVVERVFFWSEVERVFGINIKGWFDGFLATISVVIPRMRCATMRRR